VLLGRAALHDTWDETIDAIKKLYEPNVRDLLAAGRRVRECPLRWRVHLLDGSGVYVDGKKKINFVPSTPAALWGALGKHHGITEKGREIVWRSPPENPHGALGGEWPGGLPGAPVRVDIVKKKKLEAPGGLGLGDRSLMMQAFMRAENARGVPGAPGAVGLVGLRELMALVLAFRGGLDDSLNAWAAAAGTPAALWQAGARSYPAWGVEMKFYAGVVGKVNYLLRVLRQASCAWSDPASLADLRGLEERWFVDGERGEITGWGRRPFDENVGGGRHLFEREREREGEGEGGGRA
jgi:hypothetical protein